MNKILRYRASSLCFILGMSLAFISLYLGVRSEMKLKNAYAEKNANLYRYETCGTYRGEYFPLDKISNNGFGNCMVEDLYVMLNGTGTINAVNIMIYNNEDIHLPLKKGHWMTERELAEEDKPAYIGVGYADYTYEVDGNCYFDIQGEAYKVVGYIGGGKSNEYDNYILLFADNLGEMVRTQLFSDSQYMGLSLVFQSDVKSMEEAAAGSFEDETFVYYNNENSSVYVALESKTTYFWLFIYAGCVLVLVSVFWINERQLELAIRKAYGFSNTKIIWMLIKNLCMHDIISIIISMLFVISFNIKNGNFMNYPTDEIVLFFISICIYILAVTILTMIYPVICIVKKLPSIDINKKEESQV